MMGKPGISLRHHRIAGVRGLGPRGADREHEGGSPAWGHRQRSCSGGARCLLEPRRAGRKTPCGARQALHRPGV